MNLRFYGTVKDKETNKPIIGAIVKLYLNQKEIQKCETTKNGFYEIITQIEDERLEGEQQLRLTFEKTDYKMRENYIFATEGAYNMDIALHRAEVPQPKPFNWLPVIIGGGAVLVLLIVTVIALLIFFRPKASKGHALDAHDGDPVDAVYVDDEGNVGIGTTTPQKRLHIQEGSISAPLITETRRPGIAITGQYPELSLFSSVNNDIHGPAIRMGSHNDDNGDTTKQWVIGTSGRNSRFLDFGFSSHNDGNPHNGIRDFNGKTVLTLMENGTVGIGEINPDQGRRLHIAAEDNHVLFSRKGGEASGGKKLFLEFYQPDSNPPKVPVVYPCIRFHHGYRFWHRIEARPDGIHFKDGSLTNDNHIDIYAKMARFDILRLGDKWRFSAVGDAHANDDWLRIFDVNNRGYYGGLAAGRLWSSSGTLSGSDISSKKEIKSLTGSLEKIMALKGVSFKWNDPVMPQTRQMGLIAQDVEKIFPEVVVTGPKEKKGINYSALIAPLVEAIKEQQSQIEDLKLQIEEYRKKMSQVVSMTEDKGYAEYTESLNGEEIDVRF